MSPAEARQSLGLTVAEMVRICDVPRSTWNCWERGEREPGRSAQRLLDVLLWLHEHEPEAYRRLDEI